MSDKNPPHPNQPVMLDEDGRPRFRGNSLVKYLIDAGPFDLNTIRMLPNLNMEDYTQLMQLIGYSTDGYGMLSTSPEDRVAWADAEAARLKS